MQVKGRGSVCESRCAREARFNAGESPVGAIRRFSTADRANCVAARRGVEPKALSLPKGRHGVEPAGRNEHMSVGRGQLYNFDLVGIGKWASLVSHGPESTRRI